MPSLRQRQLRGWVASASTEIWSAFHLLVIGLEGDDRIVKFDMPEHGETQVQGDYLAMAGLHVDVYHWVETSGWP